MSDMTQLERIAIENSLLLSGSGGGQLYHEQYDEHGVKIEYQCFKQICNYSPTLGISVFYKILGRFCVAILKSRNIIVIYFS